MIMAAGYGERMRPLSDRLPKPLLPVLGRPLIDHVIGQLLAAGITDLGINTHHRAENIVEHLQKKFSHTLQVVFSHEKVIRGTGGGMRGLRDFLFDHEPFLVHNGDVFSTVQITDVVAFHRQYAPLVTMVLVDYPPINSVTVSSAGLINGFYRRPEDFRKPANHQYLTFTGISIVDPAVIDLIPDTIPYNIIDLYDNLIKTKSGSIQAFIPRNTYWIDVGNPAAYLRIHRDILLHGKACLPDSLTTLAGVYQGTGCSVDAGARFDGFVSQKTTTTHIY